MPLVKITPPPGVVKPGTVYDARGRWYDTLWTRWFEGVMQEIGGFEDYEVDGSQVDHGERVSGTHSWRDNDGNACLAFGGPAKIQVIRTGSLTDVTPTSGFTSGQADSTLTTGQYGAGLYGRGLYGRGDETVDNSLVLAQSYQMDNYGEDLVFVAKSDGKIYYVDIDGNGGEPAAAAVISPSAGTVPTSNTGVVVTPENFLLALGAGGDGRKIQWPDQDDETDWAATASNQAGDLFLPGRGTILAGRRAQNETLIWTETDLFSIRFIGGNFVYTAVPVGAVGAISSRCMAVVGSVAYWMGPRGFYLYDGYTKAIPSPVADYVFRDMNRNQRTKIWAEVRSEFGEVTWHYPSGGSTECDRSVTFNYEEGFWYNNTVARTAGEDAGALGGPVAFDADGLLYRHEVGNSYGGATPEATSGPIELGGGDRVMHIQSLIPDEQTLGDVDLYLLTAFYPSSGVKNTPANADASDGQEVENGPYTPSNPTDVRLVARQIRLKVVQDVAGWRIGTIRADIEAGGRR